MPNNARKTPARVREDVEVTLKVRLFYSDRRGRSAALKSLRQCGVSDSGVTGGYGPLTHYVFKTVGKPRILAANTDRQKT